MAWFDCCTHLPVRNHGGAMSAQNGLVLHHAVANGSLYGRFNDPATQVSSTFWVALDGRREQYVDSETVAWANGTSSANASYCSVETEGCTTPPYAQPMTEAMVNSIAMIYAEGHRRHGWPNQLCNAAGQRGFGYHRLFYNTACPCDVRVNRRSDILNLAFGPPPPPQGAAEMLVAMTSTGKGYWCCKPDGSVYAYGDAQYRGGLNNAGPGGSSALVAGDTITGFSASGTDGYIITTAKDNLYAFGSAPYLGHP